MNRNHDSHRSRRRRTPEDPFDYWLDLVVELLIEPLFDLVRFAWGMLRGHRPRSRSGRGDRHPRPGRRRSRSGGRK